MTHKDNAKYQMLAGRREAAVTVFQLEDGTELARALGWIHVGTFIGEEPIWKGVRYTVVRDEQVSSSKRIVTVRQREIPGGIGMTELEAKTMWCPMTRVRWAKLKDDATYVTHGDGSFNRVRVEFTSEERTVGLCIASHCMMWRTTGTEGFCGLAGIPLPEPAEAAVAAEAQAHG